MMKTISISLLFWMFSIVLNAAELYFIDAHSQYEREITGKEIIEKMDEAGVKKAIISTRRGRSAREAVELSESYPDRIIPSVRIKGKHYTRNTKKFFKKLKKQVNSGNFLAMSEVLMFHAQKGGKADELKVHADDERVQDPLSAAIDNEWPFVIHIEFASLSKSESAEFMNEVESLLTDNPTHPFALIHMGQLDEKRAEGLLRKHKNIHFLTSHADTVTAQSSNQPWINMFDGEIIKPQWKRLMVKYPNQFVFAVDAVWAEQWQDDYVKHVSLWRKGLSSLPVVIANKIAHGNAERLWSLK